MLHNYSPNDSPDAVSDTFRAGGALFFRWTKPEGELLVESMTTIAQYLAGFPPTLSFGGINQLDADRQTLWVASTGLKQPIHRDLDELARFDGDGVGGERGLQALANDETVAAALGALKTELDKSLEFAAQAIGLDEVLADGFKQLTVRYRAIRYAPIDRPIAGIGLHPDGNVLSALLTDQPGLVIADAAGEHRPSTDGTVVMPGSILYRWSNGHFRPTFHTVEIRRGTRPKFTFVAFLNFPDHMLIPRSSRLKQSGEFRNDVQRHKEDDMEFDGDLASLWRELKQKRN